MRNDEEKTECRLSEIDIHACAEMMSSLTEKIIRKTPKSTLEKTDCILGVGILGNILAYHVARRLSLHGGMRCSSLPAKYIPAKRFPHIHKVDLNGKTKNVDGKNVLIVHCFFDEPPEEIAKNEALWEGWEFGQLIRKDPERVKSMIRQTGGNPLEIISIPPPKEEFALFSKS